MKTGQAALLADPARLDDVAAGPCLRAAPEADLPQPGDLLDDRFALTEVISRSGMAWIFRAKDLHDHNADVAVKVPHPGCRSDAGYLARFRQEEEIGLRLNHPLVVRFIPVSTPRSRPYIVMEYLRGSTLAHLLEAMCPLPESDALRIAGLLCEALQYLHENGVIHRDLKPQNVMVGCDGTIRLLDFGLANARTLRRAQAARSTPVMGTPQYMAPEQAAGRRGDARTDIYCLGAMLYEMLTGQAPFEADNALATMNARMVGDPEPPRALNRAISPHVEEIVLHAMERNPSRRHPSASALRAELADPRSVSLAGRRERRRQPEFPEEAPRQDRAAILAMATPIMITAAVALWLWLRTGAH